ncbi:MAG: single-stranded-DNA-specific exonuclease RecJ [Anaerolineales bacterium]|nr:single-stranded-DNA-specific exonuclease RecJ [Anaerolineales bacterium]
MLPKTSKRWIVSPPLTPAAQAELAEFPPLIAQLLFNRGHATAGAARAFLAGDLPAGTDPMALRGLPETVDRVRRAVAAQELIVVYGDYDADGVTATALLVQVLAALGARVRAYIPSREDEGYGLNHEALRSLKADGAGLVITVDCGIRSLAEAETARAIGLDLVITDHHTTGEALPDALAVINPKRADDEYPEDHLSGAGLAFKLAQGLLRGQPQPPLTASDVLDLVALGTVADLVPLAGENRWLVRQGLKVINRPRREGLKALIEVARLRLGSIDAGNLGFALGPRLNAAGRLESALAAYDLLTTTDLFQATQLAQQLEAQNRERQALTRQTQARARELALAVKPEAYLLFAADADFRHGVVGLAAARLTEEFYRPAVVARRDDDLTRGSARSIREFHITQAFDQCQDLLIKHGGHAAAAGFTMETGRVEELAERLQALAEQELGGQDLRPAVRVDVDQVPFAELTGDLARELRQFEPCGYGNPAPVLATRGAKVVSQRWLGQEGQHLKLTLAHGRMTMDAIAFNQAAWRDNVPPYVDVAYALEINEWNGERRLQLNVRDLQPSS